MLNQKLPVIWSPRQGFVILIAFVVIYFALSGLHMAWVKHTIGFEAYLGPGPRMPPKVLILGQLFKAVAIGAVLYWLALKTAAQPASVLGLRMCERKWLVWALALALAGFVLMLVLAKFMVTALPDWARFAQARFAWSDAPAGQMLLLIGMTILITPVAEELFFRGFLLQWMGSRHRLWAAIGISSLMFGASHIIPSQVIVATFLAMGMSLLFLASRSILPSLIWHIVNNAIGVGMSLAANAGLLPSWLMPTAG
ncbi:hypothetical protein C7S18_03965 [Ahniella affigens]|uniref:CAAX prenyl protease 2/Lysostaphin resistance protein A-like domain-containing protein n=1 Tax=Ahniella affigens TaxID=2021234 RepID=A0A2P1PNI5_9GAMM|nr:CPBP family intramembrane glutamic endopeptidase [Ahniella affigens]AVP96399.1 hypothetical protein C7S18_03965 [Ahniella affigens]